MRKLILILLIFFSSCINHSDYSNYYHNNRKEFQELVDRIQKCPINDFFLIQIESNSDFTNDNNLKRIVILLDDLDLEGFEKFDGWIFLCRSSFIDNASGLAFIADTSKSVKEVLVTPIKLKPINKQWYTIGWN